MDASAYAFTHGIRHTRSTLRTWQREPWSVLGSWAAGSAAAAAGLLLAVWLISSLYGGREQIVNLQPPFAVGDAGDVLSVMKRNLLVLALHAMACVAGFIAGSSLPLQAGAGYALEMDSDFSHDPADLERLLAAVARGADLALGSRYVPGGGVSDWGLVRRKISEWGSTYARWVLGLKVRDLTGGFKCFRREVLEAIHFDSVRSRGYAFQVELTYRAVRAGFEVVEVPIVFRDRQLGQSKMSWRIALEAVWLVPRLRFR